MVRTREVDDRETTATRLLKGSVERSYEPAVDIDWDAPLLDGVFYHPPQRTSLYGTELWDRMTHEQRVELSKHEVASLASLGVWFETILMQMLLRHSYDRSVTSQHVRYALIEIADECRHSVMFSRLIERLGCPPYRIDGYHHQLGRLMKTVVSGPAMWAATLIAEEVLDTFQREAMADDTIQPLVRMVSRIHVVEEARHVRYARDELVRQMSRAGRADKAVARLITARAAYAIASHLVHPDCYAAAGLDVREARRAERANPLRRETLRWSARRLVDFFDEVGLMRGPGMVLWRSSGLV
ncbi:MAG: diiron oxygenase [Streptosporangiales bacterium]|nr:diiron oxygenase [Streptosporangiales bacterium]